MASQTVLSLHSKNRACTFLAFLLVSLSVLLFSCRTTDSLKAPDSKTLSGTDQPLDFSDFMPLWNQEIPDTVWSLHYSDPELPLIFHAFKVKLSNSSISLHSFPENSIQTARHETTTCEVFSKNKNLFLAFNTSPFTARGITRSRDKTIMGLTITEGRILNPPESRYACISFSKSPDGSFIPDISRTQTIPSALPDYTHGGFFQILKDSKPAEFIQNRDTRLALGITADKSLIILAVEGENKRHSKGLSYGECASLLLKLGAVDALQMDGGGSTQLYFNHKNVLSYRIKRKVPALLGFSLK